MDNDVNSQKVFVALSGGVDSAVSAALLKEQGYDVTGVYMKNWSGDDFGIQADCPWEVDQSDAEEVCRHLNIPFRSFNFEKQYREKVVEYFFSEYEKGRTPNPDVMCNKEIKFKLFLDKAIDEGADLIATGHYARRVEETAGNSKIEIRNPKQNAKVKKLKLNDNQTENELSAISYRLLTGLDDIKNQTYFLYNITQEQLSKTLFPIGHMPKSEVRKLAERFNLPNKNKPDSQGICFIGEIDVLKFLTSTIDEKLGNIVDIDTNEVVGEHKGIYFYTIGQRKGLQIGGQEVPYYVVSKDNEKNILYVGHGHNHPKMYEGEVTLENLHLINPKSEILNSKQPLKPETQNSKLEASIRYQQKPQPGVLKIDEDQIKFIFDKPQWGIASGQSLVIYRGEECLGGGIIS